MKNVRLLFVAALLVIAAPLGADPNVIVVDDDGAQCPTPITSIQAGVNFANPGDTVKVCAGTYAGGVIINKAGLTLDAVGPLGAVVIEGPGAPPLSPPPAGPKFGLTIVANDVKVKGFEIRRFADQHDASGIFVGGLFAGDTANPADGAAIEHNDIHDNGNGIYLWQSNDNKIRQNWVHDNKNVDGDEGTGILSFNGFGDTQTALANANLRSGLNNDISHNTVYNNDRLGIFAGACTEAAFGCVGPTGVHANLAGTRIEHNDLFGNGAAGTEAVGFLDASGGTIAHNKVHDNAYHGILVNFSDGATVGHNKADDNSLALAGYSGIRISGSQTLTVTDNKTGRNGRGISVTGSTGGQFARNDAKNNAVVDLNWDASGANTFKKNKCGTASPSKAAWDCK